MEIIKYDLPSTDDEDETRRSNLSAAPQSNNNEQYANLDLSGPVTWNSMTSFSNYNFQSGDQSCGQNSQSAHLPDSYTTCLRI